MTRRHSVTLEADSPVPLGILLGSQHAARNSSPHPVTPGDGPIQAANPAVVTNLVLALEPDDRSPLFSCGCHDTMLPYCHDTEQQRKRADPAGQAQGPDG